MVNLNEYQEFVDEYIKKLYRYCFFRLSKIEELTNETVNDVLWALYKKWDKLDKTNIVAFMYRTADNCIKNNLKKRKKLYDQIDSLERLTEEGLLQSFQSTDTYFDSKYSYDEAISLILCALEKEEQLLFELRFIKKENLESISKEIGIPYSTLRYKLLKIETKVRKIINNL